ncbi:MAG: hypothetical protein HY907_17690 [Deltaproteobacteria bacterium]|nr:hypothetical protein [Deltaproteobacteria bacterium]
MGQRDRGRAWVPVVLLGVAWAAWGGGCGKAKESAGGGAGAEAAAAPAEGAEFRVEARHEAAAKVGETVTAVLTATGVAPWHVNVEYPVKLEIVAAEGFAGPASPMRKEAAAKLDESELRFEVPLVAEAAGERPVELKLKFGLCSADRCITREATERWTVLVGEE